MTDLRVAIGFFFLLVGGLVTGVGVVRPELRAPLTGVNVNLYAGLGIFFFGGVMLWLGRRRSS
jgi:hypothetical protein